MECADSYATSQPWGQRPQAISLGRRCCMSHAPTLASQSVIAPPPSLLVRLNCRPVIGYKSFAFQAAEDWVDSSRGQSSDLS